MEGKFQNITTITENEDDESIEDEEAKILCFTKELIPCKLLFFTLDASHSALFSFLGLFYITSGLSVTQLGLMNGMGSGFAFIAHPIWGSIVDSTSKYRRLLLISLTIGTTAVEFVKPWVVMFFSKAETIMTCTGNTSEVQTALYNISSNCTTHEKILNQDTLFYATTFNCILSSIIISGLTTYIEGAVVKTVFTRKTEHFYGEQKVFGPIGMAFGSFVAGVSVDHYKPEHLSPYLAAFYVYLPLSLLQIPLLLILTKQANWDYGNTKKTRSQLSLKIHLSIALKKQYNIMFLFSTFIAGLTFYTYKHFLFLYMYKVMNPSKTVLSLMSVASSSFEFFIYMFSSKLIKLFGGHMRCIITAMSLGSVCLVVLSFAKSPLTVLPLAMMSGVIGSLSWTAMIEKTWMIFPKDISNTSIGILHTFHKTGSSIISNVFGGMLFHKYGGGILFRGMAIINGIWCLVMICYFEMKTKTQFPSVSPVEKSHSSGNDIGIDA